MVFVNAGLLIGTIFVAVPIALHLIMRQRPQWVEFPALRFLRSHQQANRRKLRLRHFLLLLLRIACVALLAFALARPSLRGSSIEQGDNGKIAAALIVDTSPRMEYVDGETTRLQLALDAADWILSRLPEASQVAVLDSESTRPFYSVDLLTARRTLERIEITPGARPLPELLSAALELLSDTEDVSREIYVLSDLTRPSWSGSNPEELAAQIEQLPELQLHIVDVGVHLPRNRGLGLPRLSPDVLTGRTPLTITVDCHYTGPEREAQVELALVDSQNRERKRAEQDASGESSVELRIGPLEHGTHQGVVRLSPPDPLAVDNERFFTVEVRPAGKVLVAASRQEDATLLAEMLAPTPMRQQGTARFDCTAIAMQDLSEHILTEYAVVCLHDPPRLPASIWRSVASYLQQGGGLALFLADSASARGDLQAAVLEGVLPGELKRKARAATYLTLQPRNHPALSRFVPLVGNVPWQAFPVAEYWQLEIGSARVIAQFANGDPAMLELPVEPGRAFLWTTPAVEPPTRRQRWNQLTIGDEPWPFFMLFNESVRYLSGESQQRLNYGVGEPATLALPYAPEAGLVSLRTPSGERTRISVDPRTVSVPVTSTDQVGNYRVQAGGGQNAIDQGFSVNFSGAISDLERVDESLLTSWLGEDRWHLSRERIEMERQIDVGRIGDELFGYVIALVAALMACEQLLSNRFYRR